MSLFDDLRGQIDMAENELIAQMTKVQNEVNTLAEMIGSSGDDPTTPPSGNMTMEKWLQLVANWTYSWPVNKPGATDSPMNIYLTAATVPAVALFERNGGIVSRAPAKGVTTKNSNYPRAEFRQMIDRDWNEAEFSLAVLNSLELDFTSDISNLVTRKRQCCLQIHGGNDDICQVIHQDGDGLIFSHNDGNSILTVDRNYQNNQRTVIELKANDNQIFVIQDGVQKVNVTKKSSSAYFKFGPYLQTGGRSEHVEPAGAYGEMTMYNMKLVTTA